MSKTQYTNLYDISDLQQSIVRYITFWARTEKTPIPKSAIYAEMLKRGVGNSTVKVALRGLVNQGYIRRAIIISNKTSYVQLKSI